ncbi:MAG: Glu/Leu/Phe/Val dehydrogenase [Bdellovibrionales bacterium]|nr:Glu/Leu/Phe/Val dehydrogenase [Bdellovibrionales bacterium]
MKYFETVHKEGHEQVSFFFDPGTGLKAIIAIHNTTLGPALGGTRMWNYATEQEALTDVLRLSKGMTYKAAAAGLRLGGGKAVIIGNPKTDKTDALFRAFGKAVNTLGGRYITAEDVGTSVQDMEHVSEETTFVTGIDEAKGGSGDPSPLTAFGTLQGIKASVKHKMKRDDLKGLTVALQGVGHVGWHLAGLLKQEGAKVIVSDIDFAACQRAEKELGIDGIVNPDEIYDVQCEIFAPCALGAIINDQTLPRLKCQIVAGASNNQLAVQERHGVEIEKRGIAYAPDYVINAGGLMNVYVELEGYSQERAYRICSGIYNNVAQVFDIAEKQGIPTYQAADRLVEQRLNRATNLSPRFNASFARGR